MAGAGSETVTFTVASGALSATSGGGVVVGGTANALTLTGTLTDLNDFLGNNGLTFTTALNNTSPVTLGVSLNDSGHSGSGGPQSSGVTNVTLNVTPVNDEQVLATNTGVTVAENSTGTVITSAMLATTDVDNTAAQLIYTLTRHRATGRYA